MRTLGVTKFGWFFGWFFGSWLVGWLVGWFGLVGCWLVDWLQKDWFTLFISSQSPNSEWRFFSLWHCLQSSQRKLWTRPSSSVGGDPFICLAKIKILTVN